MSSLQKTPSTSIEDIAAINKPSREQTLRHSLPLKTQKSDSNESVSLRHTQSQNYGKTRKVRKTNPPAPIPETEVVDTRNVTVEIHNERRRSKLSTQGHDNAGFQNDSGKRSRTSSISTHHELQSGRSSHNPSISNSQVYQEQYCWCARPDRTHCERVSFAVMGVLVFIIIILVIVVIIVAKKNNSDPKEVLNNMFGI